MDEYMRLLKILFLIISSIISVSAHEYNLVKTSDGTSTYCENRSDIISNRFQAYKIQKIRLMEKKEGIQLRLAVSAVVCRESRGGEFDFEKVDLFKPFSYRVLALENQEGNRLYQKVSVDTQSAELKVYRDGEYKEIGYLKKNHSHQKVTYFTLTLKYEDLLKNAFIKAEKHSTSFDFFLTRNVKVKSNNYFQKEKIVYGNYRVHLDLRWNGENAEILKKDIERLY